MINNEIAYMNHTEAPKMMEKRETETEHRTKFLSKNGRKQKFIFILK